MEIQAFFFKTVNWVFSITVVAVGIINTFWGNDSFFGIFLVVLSLVYLPPLTALLKEKTGITINWAVKIALALFIFWAVLGVGELFDKIALMMADIKMEPKA